MLTKYPDTKHLRGSKGVVEDTQTDPQDLDNIVVEEKLDGAEVRLSFNEQGQEITSAQAPVRGPVFSEIWSWFYPRQDEFQEALGTTKVLWLEWMLPKKTVFYDKLPSYAMVFDVYDQETQSWLSTPRRKELLEDCNVSHVPVLYEGPASECNFEDLLNTPSLYKSDRAVDVLQQKCDDWERTKRETYLSDQKEGLYIKEETGDQTVGWYKYIHEGFVDTIVESGTHWKDRTLIKNELDP